jgi:hypothetical protein
MAPLTLLILTLATWRPDSLVGKRSPRNIQKRKVVMIFVIKGIQYTVEPDATGKVSSRGLWVTKPRGFNGKTFVILPFEGGRIVTHNLWMEGETDKPDNATVEGEEPKTVRIARTSWEKEHLPK